MRKEVIMPKIGLDMTEGTILEWKKVIYAWKKYGKTDDSKLGSTAVYAVFRSRLRKADQLP